MEPFAVVDRGTLYRGDARAVLRGLPEGSVSVCLTSPPYWSLRRYADSLGEQEQVWGGGESCEHSWQDESYRESRKNDETAGEKQRTNSGATGWRNAARGYAVCEKCGAVRCALGLEKSPEQYVSNLVSVFRAVKRVLHPTGVCWVNLGDGYASDTKWGGSTSGKHADRLHGATGIGREKRRTGLKPTDLIGVPFLVAEALRADGWYLRSIMPWVKPANPMPESVTSRPVSSIEYWLMLTKLPGGGAYYDAEAVRTSYSQGSLSRYGYAFGRGRAAAATNNPSVGAGDGKGHTCNPNPSGRAFRVSDLFLASLDEEIADTKARLAHLEACRGKKGDLLLDEDGDPLALLVNPRPFSGAKYLGDCSRKEWRLIDPQDPAKGSRKVEVWYIAAPECEAHRHYHRADKWAKLGYAGEREREKPAECGCLEVMLDHYAAFSEQLIEPLIRACCPESVCKKCGAPKVRAVKSERVPDRPNRVQDRNGDTLDESHGRDGRSGNRCSLTTKTLGWSPSCSCEGAGFIPGLVIDIFSGTGTTGAVAKREGRRYIGVDTSVDYLIMSAARIAETGLRFEVARTVRGGQGTLSFE